MRRSGKRTTTPPRGAGFSGVERDEFPRQPLGRVESARVQEALQADIFRVHRRVLFSAVSSVIVSRIAFVRSSISAVIRRMHLKI
jgi:hypothetical protein